MGILRKKTKLIHFFFWTFVLFQLINLLKDILHGYPKDSWGITEYLINYEGGFVRRGLLGHILLLLHQMTGISPYYSIIIIALAAYLFVVFFLFKGFVKNGYPIFFLPFVAVLGNPILNGFWLRKDSLILCLFILALIIFKKKNIASAFVASVIMAVGILIHEALFFVAFPLFFWLNYKNEYLIPSGNVVNRTAMAFTVMMPVIAAFICVALYKGDRVIAQKIWSSWDNVPFPYLPQFPQRIPTSIRGLSLGFNHGYDITYGTLVNFQDNIYAPFFWVITLLTIYYILTQTDRFMFKIGKYKPSRRFDSPQLGNVLIFQFIAVCPLFLLGLDYGRWVYLWTVSVFVFMILYDDELYDLQFPSFISRIRSKLDNALSVVFSPSSVRVLIFFVCFPENSWNLMESIVSGGFYYTLSSISVFLRDFLWYIKYGTFGV